MTKEQLDDLCQLIRAYNRARTDCILMSGMLLKSETSGIPPADWLEELRMLRELPAHKASLEETERLVSLIRDQVHEDSLMKLISCIPKSNLPN